VDRPSNLFQGAPRVSTPCLRWWGRLCRRRCAAGGCARAVLVWGGVSRGIQSSSYLRPPPPAVLLAGAMLRGPSEQPLRARRTTPYCRHTRRRHRTGQLSLYKILYYLKALLWESIIVYCPPYLQRIAYCDTIARRLRNIRPPTDPPPLYAIRHTLLVMAILCKCQRSARQLYTNLGWRSI